MPRVRRRPIAERRPTGMPRDSRATTQARLGYPPGIEWSQRDDYLDVLAQHRRATGWTPPTYTTEVPDA